MSDRSQYIIGILVSLMIAAAYLYFSEDRVRTEPNLGATPELPVAIAPSIPVEWVLLKSPASDPVGVPSLIAPSLTKEALNPEVADPERLDQALPEDALEAPKIQPEPGSHESQSAEPPSGAA